LTASKKDLNVDVGLQEGQADLAQCVVDVFIGDLALTPEAFKGQFELVS
jgi:hypothetical protein